MAYYNPSLHHLNHGLTSPCILWKACIEEVQALGFSWYKKISFLFIIPWDSSPFGWWLIGSRNIATFAHSNTPTQPRMRQNYSSRMFLNYTGCLSPWSQTGTTSYKPISGMSFSISRGFKCPIARLTILKLMVKLKLWTKTLKNYLRCFSRDRPTD